jgi:hypothetical protein
VVGNHVSRGGMSLKLQAEAVSPQVLKTYEQESEQAVRSLGMRPTVRRGRKLFSDVEETAVAWVLTSLSELSLPKDAHLGSDERCSPWYHPNVWMRKCSDLPVGSLLVISSCRLT